MDFVRWLLSKRKLGYFVDQGHTAYFTEISCDYVVLRRLAPLQWYLDPLPRVGVGVGDFSDLSELGEIFRI